MYNNQKVINILGYDLEITSINGRDIERFYFAGDQLVKSTILYHGETEHDPHKRFLDFFQPKRRWYVCGSKIDYVEG